MNGNSITNQRMTPEIRRGVIALVFKAGIGVVFLGAILFLPAGRWDWVGGWVFISLFAAASITQFAILLPTNPALLAERSRGIRKGTKSWDKWIVAFAAGLLPMASWIISGFDVRFRWSPAMPLALQIAGGVGFALGWAVILWATSSNAFFSTTVRIQEERAHAVQTGGPYQFVRHPGYVGAILYQLATPFLLGSWWAVIVIMPSLPLYVLRTALEDKTLHEALDGYRDYARQVRYRLLPGLW